MVFVTRSFVYCCCYGITSVTVIIVPLFPFPFLLPSPTPSLFVPLLTPPSPRSAVFQADLELALFPLWPLEYWDYRCISPPQLGEAPPSGESGIYFKSVLNGNCSAPDFGQKIMLLPKLIGVVLGVFLWYLSITTSPKLI